MSPASARPAQQSSLRSRHIPITGLGIQHEDPFVEVGGSSSWRLPREDSDSTLVPKKQAESIASRPSHDLKAPPPSLNTILAVESASANEVHPCDERRGISRAHSADYLTQILSKNSAHSTENESGGGSISDKLASRFALKRLRSSPAVPGSSCETTASSLISPLFKIRSRKFNRAFEFPKQTFHIKYENVVNKIRKMSGVSDVSESSEVEQVDKGKGRVVQFEEPASVASPPKLMSSRLEKAQQEIQQVSTSSPKLTPRKH